MEDQKDKVLENLLANGMDLPTYMTRFKWDLANYQIKQSLLNLYDIIGNELTFIISLLITIYSLFVKLFLFSTYFVFVFS